MQVEKLIKELPSIPVDWSNGYVNSASKDHLSNGISLQHIENSTSLRETQSMLLERIASEMNRLKFYITHAQVFFAGPHVNLLYSFNYKKFHLLLLHPYSIIRFCIKETN